MQAEIGSKIHNEADVVKNIESTKPYTIEDTAYREFYFKLKNIKDRIFTSEGKRIAQERHEFIVTFFDKLNKETNEEIK